MSGDKCVIIVRIILSVTYSISSPDEDCYSDRVCADHAHDDPKNAGCDFCIALGLAIRDCELFMAGSHREANAAKGDHTLLS